MARGSRKRRLHRESRVRKPVKSPTAFTDPLFWPGVPALGTVRMPPTWADNQPVWPPWDWVNDPAGQGVHPPFSPRYYARNVILEDPDGTQE